MAVHVKKSTASGSERLKDKEDRDEAARINNTNESCVPQPPKTKKPLTKTHQHLYPLHSTYLPNINKPTPT